MGNDLTNFLTQGEENATTAQELATVLGWNRREVTAEINALRKSGTVICSSGKGYYFPADKNDVQAFVRHMHSRIADMRSATQSAERYLQS